ncbi:MAG: helix-hairpin-helix domain-containing protein [Planctomycetes bacterium]|nr:helix-hairpin-helix domain-containing protein [Planctomycetota bacterium]
MSPGRRRVLLGVWAFLVFALAVRALARGLLPTDVSGRVELRPVLVDVNHASVGELMSLPSIGAVRAEAIVLERIRRGPFRSLDDIDRVDGLGPGACASLRELVTFGIPGETRDRPRD